MKLLEIARRATVPEPWAEGEKIPWDELAFSRRMLAEHLSQAHDHASRRAATIDRHVDWIDRVALADRTARILDLGCGPGLYLQRLAALGHSCVGIDFGPAAIAHAVATAEAAGLDCAYHLGDIRETAFGSGYDLVMLIFGELNVFRRADALTILAKARQALKQGGWLLLEVHTVEAIRRIGTAPASWRSADRGLFSDVPHLRLEECFWDAEQSIATERYYIIDAETAAVRRYAQSIQAYSDAEYAALLSDNGFALRGSYPSFGDDVGGGDFVVLLGVAE